LLGLGVYLALAGGPVWAGDVAPTEIGRVGTVAGPVQIAAGGAEWSDALVNEPAAAGTGLRSATDAETGLSLPGARLALAAAGELKILRLDRDVVQIAVIKGRIGVHLDATARIAELDLPRGGVWLAAPGDYDIAAGDAQTPARVEVFAGKALVGGGLGAENLVAAASDTFSDWWRSQSADAESAAVRRLAPDIVGAAALDGGGSWKADPTYGEVWYPQGLSEDWAPYRDGVWRFLPPSGWTWVDNAAWGFAPSHYGRWARIDNHWAWVPPPPRSEPEYSPAAVAFLGTAPIGLSCPGNMGPAVAWFPLAPGETIGDGNDENYRNRRFASAVPRAVFAAGRAVAPSLVDLPEQRFADAPVILGPLGIPPAKAELVASSAKKPAIIAVAAMAGSALKKRLVVALAAVTPKPKPVVSLAARKPVLARLHAAGPSPLRKRLTMAAAALVVRPRAAPSTSAIHPTHNRQHLAAARGGAL